MIWKCGTNVGEERCLEGLGQKPEGKGLLGRPRRGRENNIHMVLQDIGWGLELN
jgi:hypothetical protein